MNYDLIVAMMNALRAEPLITNLIGAGTDARIFWEIAPAGMIFPRCYLSTTHVTRDTWYLGGGGRDREVLVSVNFVGRTDQPTSQRDVLLLDKYADAALNNNVSLTGLVSLRRYADVPNTAASDAAQGTVEYFSAGGIYRALMQVSS